MPPFCPRGNGTFLLPLHPPPATPTSPLLQEPDVLLPLASEYFSSGCTTSIDASAKPASDPLCSSTSTSFRPTESSLERFPPTIEDQAVWRRMASGDSRVGGEEVEGERAGEQSVDVDGGEGPGASEG